MTSTATFADLGVPDDLTAALGQLGITAPFPIQSATIADALAGRDLCGRAPTGSGKTLAFALPTVVRVGRSDPKRPRALILTPTRELAAQVRDTILPLAKLRRRWVATVYGGTNVKRDIQQLARGIDILVATPGRLADLISQGACSLADVRIVVIDEADRMADMGFLPEVRKLLDQTRDDRQTLLFSATLDGDVDVLIRHYQSNPARHVMDDPVGELGEVTHLFWPAKREDRRRLTTDIVGRVSPALVFTRTKHGADRLAKQLARDGVRTAAIHGNRSQNQRERALKSFANGTVTTLVATDVAARGIHVDDIGVVVHYDLPGSGKDYVHRSGRTGRAGARGVVVSLVLDEQNKDVREIQRSLDMPSGLHSVKLDDLDTDEPVRAPDLHLAGGGGKSGGGSRGNGGGARRNGQGRGGARNPNRRARNGDSHNGRSAKGGHQGNGRAATPNRGSGNRRRRAS